MGSTKHVVYIGAHGEGVEIADLLALPGEPIELDADIVGHAPTGVPGDEKYDPGVGLLAQPSNWRAATAAESSRAKKGDTAPDEPEPTREEQA